jgi:hypothetical protein
VGDSAINGKTWNEAEQDMVVGDYLVMLDKVMTGRAYDPANHQRALRFVTNRSGGAITFLQGEISAVLTLIGLPTLKDHPPRWDFGDSLADSVERCLTARPAVLKDLVQPPALLGCTARADPGRGRAVASPPRAAQRSGRTAGRQVRPRRPRPGSPDAGPDRHRRRPGLRAAPAGGARPPGPGRPGPPGPAAKP